MHCNHVIYTRQHLPLWAWVSSGLGYLNFFESKCSETSGNYLTVANSLHPWKFSNRFCVWTLKLNFFLKEIHEPCHHVIKWVSQWCRLFRIVRYMTCPNKIGHVQSSNSDTWAMPGIRASRLCSVEDHGLCCLIISWISSIQKKHC